MVTTERSYTDDHSLRNSVALWTLWFAQLEKETQQMLLMEKIREIKLVLVVVVDESPLYLLPFPTELLELAEVL
jgi:hypothetical protein